MQTPHANDTHDPALKSWVESANDARTDFPIQNLPFIVFDRAPEVDREDFDEDDAPPPAVGVAIGDYVLDLSVLHHRGMLGGTFLAGAEGADLLYGSLNLLACMDPGDLLTLRRHLQKLLRHDNAALRDKARVREEALVHMDEVAPLVPLLVENYTDFYASKFHATNVGAMFRPDNPLLPNYRHVPIGYHGRASSVVVSGTDIVRPRGQQSPPDADPGAGPSFGPCRMLDYEMEMGVFVGQGNALFEPIPISDARRHIFGLCILNDWSARDMQKWEYQPLGPFLAKNFATSISPFVVTMDALEPFRVPGPRRDGDDPRPLDYLRGVGDMGLDITVEVLLQSEQMRGKGLDPVTLSRGGMKDLYWTIDQILAHHASNGCNLMPGDLLGTGTISGPEKSSRGCLLELTWDGIGPDGKPKPRAPVQLPTGESRTFLADGDEVIMRAYCEKPGLRRIGFGECIGRVLPAKEPA